MDTAQVVSLVVALGSVAGVVLAYFKFKPGERERVDMTVSQAHMTIAQGTFQMVTTELEDQFKRMSVDLADLHAQLRTVRTELAQVQGELTETKRRLEIVTQERNELRQENQELRRNVRELEERVRHIESE